MANAYKCDVCGNLFTRECVPDITIQHYRKYYGEDRYDLCPKCQEKLETLLKQGKGLDDDE